MKNILFFLLLISTAGFSQSRITLQLPTGGSSTDTTSLSSRINAKQNGDADLTAIAALSGTNNIYYRSAADTWTGVTIGTNLSFSGGTLSASGGSVSDGDKGDITISSSGTVFTIDNAVVTLAKTSNIFKDATTASSGTPTPSGDGRQNTYTITALATNPTFSAPSGTAADQNTLLIRITDNGTTRTLSWNAIYDEGSDLSLPTATIVGETMYVQFVYNSAASKWQLIGRIGGF